MAIPDDFRGDVDALVATANPALRASSLAQLEQLVWANILQRGAATPQPLAEFRLDRPDIRPVHRAFVYDRASQSCFVGGSGVHAMQMALLYSIRTLIELPAWEPFYNHVSRNTRSSLADAYVNEGMGMYRSNPSAQRSKLNLYAGKMVKLTPSEAALFQDYMIVRV